jgi:hypothetical protein
MWNGNNLFPPHACRNRATMQCAAQFFGKESPIGQIGPSTAGAAAPGKSARGRKSLSR